MNSNWSFSVSKEKVSKENEKNFAEHMNYAVELSW